MRRAARSVRDTRFSTRRIQGGWLALATVLFVLGSIRDARAQSEIRDFNEDYENYVADLATQSTKADELSAVIVAGRLSHAFDSFTGLKPFHPMFITVKDDPLRWWNNQTDG